MLVNIAGGVLGQVGQPLEDVTLEQWNAIIAVNLSRGLLLCRRRPAAPGMKAAYCGRAHCQASPAAPGWAARAPALLSRCSWGGQGRPADLAGCTSPALPREGKELGPYNITVNNIAPGFVRSNPTTEKQWQSYGAAGQQALLEGIALRRLGQPADIAHGVLFLASEYAGWISGQVISIDGGK